MPTAKRGPSLTDAAGSPTSDPTHNVIALVEANARAAEMLREADTRFNDAVTSHIKELNDLRANCNHELSDLRAEYAERMRVSDLDRLAKTRDVDVLQGTTSAKSLADAVQVLANTSDRNAGTLRDQLTATAQMMAKQTADQAAVVSTQTASQFKDVNERIAELQRSMYTTTGKSAVSDPAVAEMSAILQKLLAQNASSEGQSKGAGSLWVLLLGGAGLLVGLITAAAAVATVIVMAKH